MARVLARQGRVPAPLLTSFDVIVPSKELQEEFDDYVTPIFSQINCLLDQNAVLRKARDLLLSRLMDGKIEV